MRKKITYSLSIVLSTLLFTACGGGESSTKTKQTLIPAHESIIKLNRANWEDVNQPGESSLGVLKKSLDNNLIEIQLDKGDNVGEHIQFFIDSDHNADTGYKRDKVDGADYLIEDGRLYKSTSDGEGWNWERIDTAEFTNSDTTVYAKTTTDVIPNITPNYRVAAMSMDASWTRVSNILMTPIAHGGNGGIVIDANSDDWANIEVVATSDVGSLKVTDDVDNIYFLLENGNTGEHTQIFLNLDNDANTGFTRSIEGSQMGAEYYIEDDRLYKSTANGDSWQWTLIGNVTRSKNANTIEIELSKNAVGVANQDKTIKVGVIGWDATFDEDVSHLTMQDVTITAQGNGDVHPGDGVITIDADASDWAGIDILATSDVGDLKLADDSEKLYFLLNNGNAGNHTQFYLNLDNNDNSGYTRTISGTTTGAEYLIEDDRLYKSTADGQSWNWNQVGTVQRAKNGNLIEISVTKEQLGVANVGGTIKVGVIGWDATFENDVSHLGMSTYTLTGNPQGLKDLVISEVMASNGHGLLDRDFYQFSDWIELHNQSAHSIDISNYTLGDKIDEGSWTIPAGTVIPAHGYMLFWADKEDTVQNEFHTDFSLKSKGEAVALFDTAGVLVDGFEFDKQKTDISTAIVNNNPVYMNPTPNAANGAIYNEAVLSSTPTFSTLGGFYTDTVTVSITASAGATIYYTLDGSLPTKNSLLYNGAITINSTSVLRSRALEDGKFLSDEATQTYFINENSTMPVISISTDEKYLFDDTVGIYTVGTNGVEGCNNVVANYMQEWDRPAHMEYFDKGKNLGFTQELELKISGQCSRQRMQKSLAIKADDKYGPKKISYKLFDDKPFTELKSFKLRNAGQDWYEAMFRDALSHYIVKDDLNVDYQAYKPSLVFINGKYWGIHNIREKRNEDYLAANYPDLDPKKVDILYAYTVVKEGSADDYQALVEYIQNHPLSDDANYKYVSDRVDIDNFIDYQITQIYIANFDWPVNNTRYWKEQKAGAKWRWMLEDQDASFYLFKEFDASKNVLEIATSQNSELYGNDYRNPPESTFMLRNLLQNDTFKEKFVSKFRGYLDTTFEPTKVNTLVDSFKDRLEPEMQRHIDRWRGDGPNDPLVEDMGDWNMFVNRIKDFANRRADAVKGHLTDMFGN